MSCSSASSPGAWGKAASPGDLYRVWHKAPAAAGGTDLAPGPLQRHCPFERIWILFEWIFLWIWGDAALLPEPALTGGEASKRQLSPLQRPRAGSGI